MRIRADDESLLPQVATWWIKAPGFPDVPPLALGNGAHVLGSGSGADLRVCDADVLPEHAVLHVTDDHAHVQPHAHAQLHINSFVVEAGSSAQLVRQDINVVELGGVILHIWLKQPLLAADVQGNRPISGSSNSAGFSKYRLGVIVFFLGLVLGLGWFFWFEAGVGDMASTAKGRVPRPDNRPQTLAERVKAIGLRELQVRPGGSARQQRLVGLLHTSSDCAKLQALRAQLGAEGFSNEVVCLPDALASVRETLSDNGAVVEQTEDGLVLKGTLVGPDAKGKVSALSETFAPNLRVEVTYADDALVHQELLEKLKARIAFIDYQSGMPHLVMRSGERVFEGGKIGEGLFFTKVLGRVVILRMGDSDLKLVM